MRQFWSLLIKINMKQMTVDSIARFDEILFTRRYNKQNLCEKYQCTSSLFSNEILVGVCKILFILCVSGKISYTFLLLFYAYALRRTIDIFTMKISLPKCVYIANWVQTVFKFCFPRLHFP